jgi:hypothetical protein
MAPEDDIVPGECRLLPRRLANGYCECLLAPRHLGIGHERRQVRIQRPTRRKPPTPTGRAGESRLAAGGSQERVP